MTRSSLPDPGLVAGGAGIAGGIEPGLEALPRDANGDRPGEVHVADRAVLGSDGMLALPERGDFGLAHPVVHEQLAPLVVEAGRLHGRLRAVPGTPHFGADL